MGKSFVVERKDKKSPNNYLKYELALDIDLIKNQLAYHIVSTKRGIPSRNQKPQR